MDDTKFDHLVKKVAFGFKQHILFAVVIEYLFIYLSPPGLSCSMGSLFTALERLAWHV